jgi:starvation-inducible DNA-binding protein
MDHMEIMMQPEGMSKQNVAECLADTLGNAVVIAFKAQGHHWNVKGIHFGQFHDFFATLYEDYASMWDPLAENMQKLGYDAPFRLAEFARLTSMEDMTTGNDPIAMVADLIAANSVLIKSVNDCFNVASACGEQGIADYMAGRDDVLKKWDWQLKSYLSENTMGFGR